MYDDEMTEADLASTAEDYYRVTQQEVHDEQIAVMRAYIASLEAVACMLRRRSQADTLAMCALR